MKRKIYLDYASTTPICTEAKKAMKKVEDIYANPSSLYASGVEAKRNLELARKSVADILGVRSEEIIFTSGGTEGNNLIIFGLYNFLLEKEPKKKFHIITSTIEHSSVLEPIRELEKRGVEVTYIRPSEEGVINPREIRRALRKETFLVSIMFANNEIGTIQPIREIAKEIRRFKSSNSKLETPNFPLFHTDACQAPNYLEINVRKLGVDFMTLDGGKIYGPKGVGSVFRRKTAHHEDSLKSLFFGGGQENGVRSGTENISLALGFAAALRAAATLREKESTRLIKLRDYFFKKVLEKIPNATINGSVSNRLPNNINICIPGLNAEFAVFQLDEKGIESSSASTCMNIKEENYSYVISEIGKKSCASSSLRFTLGRSTAKKEIDHCLKVLSEVLLGQNYS